MKWLFRSVVALTVVLAGYTCASNANSGNNQEVKDLQDWAARLTVDNDPATDPGTPQDSAYLLVQSRAICAAVEYMEAQHNPPLDPNNRPVKVKALCPVGPPDPVFPPSFPPVGTN